jgi:hypothetical protein
MPTGSPHAEASARNPARRTLAALGTAAQVAAAAGCGSVTATTGTKALTPMPPLNVAPLVIK